MPDPTPGRPPERPRLDPTVDTEAAAGPSLSDGATRSFQPAEPYPFLGPPTHPNDLGTLGPYRVVKLLGEGGMGFVFRAEDDQLRRPVALKVMRPEVAAGPIAKDRFLREGRAAAGLQSDHVVTIYQVGEANGVPFLAMEFLDGSALDDWLKARPGPASVGAVLKVARDTLRGLAVAHEKGLVHRDIKPANLWVVASTSRIKLLDFGLTRDAGGADQVTREGAVVGTPAYMAPEQANGLPLDGRADLFSVGVVLYGMFAGKSPFQRGTMLATITALATETPPPVDAVAPGVPADVAAFITRLLAKDPAGRPADARAALAELQVLEKRIRAAASDPGGPAVAAAPVVSTTHAVPVAEAADPWADVAAATAVEPTPVSAGRVGHDPVVSRTPPRGRGGPPWLLAGGLVALLAAGGAAVFVLKGRSVADSAAATAPETGRAAVPPTRPSQPPTPTAPVLPDWKPSPAAWAATPVGQSPLDKLDPALIPKEERFDWQPKELVAVVGRHRQRHWGVVRRMALSPKGDILATVGDDLKVRLWDAATMNAVAELHTGLIAGGRLGFSPDGRWLSASDYRLAVFDLKARSLKGDRTSVPGWATTTASEAPFAPDSNTLWALHGGSNTSGVTTVTVWDLTAAMPRKAREFPLPRPSQYLYPLPAGRLLAVWPYYSNDKNPAEAVLYDVSGPAPKELAALKLDNREFAVEPRAGQLAVVTGPDKGWRVRVYDLGGGTFAEAGGFDDPTHSARPVLRFAEDGRQLLYGRESDWAIRDPAGGAVRRVPKDAILSPGFATSYDPARSVFYAANGDQVRTYAFGADGSFRETAGDPDGPGRWARYSRLSADRTRVLTQTLPASQLPERNHALADLTGPTPVVTAVERLNPRLAFAVLADGRVAGNLAASGNPFAVTDPAGGPVVPVTGVPALLAAQGSRNGRWMAVRESGGASQISLHPVNDRTLTPAPPLAEWPGNIPPYGTTLDFSPDDSALLARADTNGQESVHVWSLRGPKHLGGFRWVTGHGFAADRPTLAVAFAPGDPGGPKVRLFDYSGPALKETLAVPLGPEVRLKGVLPLPGGTELLTCDEAGAVKVLALPSGKVLREWQYPGPAEFAAAYDGRHVFSLNGNGTVYVLRFPTPK